MTGEYITVSLDGTYEFTEKKSRFISHVFHVKNEEEIREILSSIKKEYYDASHNCYAYILGEHGEIQKSSDDGEPQGTAGRPILAVLEGESVTDTLCVVTRYFGGTLLGTGGLVRAYTKAARDGIKNSGLKKRLEAQLFYFKTSYSDYGKLETLLEAENLIKEDVVFSDNVTLTVKITAFKVQGFIKKLNDLTNGRTVSEKLGDTYVFIEI